MKDSKVERFRQQAMMLKQQFLQSDTGIFDQAIGNQEIATIMSELETPHRECIYPPLDTLRLFVGQVLRLTACQDVVGRRLSEQIGERTQHRFLLRRAPAIASHTTEDTGYQGSGSGWNRGGHRVGDGKSGQSSCLTVVMLSIGLKRYF